MHPITIIERVVIDADSVTRLRDQCEASEDQVWITRHLPATRHTLRGVPGRLVTVDLAQVMGYATGTGMVPVLEIGRKVGRYDDRADPGTRARDSLTVRPWPTCLDGSGRPKRYDTPSGLRDVRTGGSLTVERWDDSCQVCVTWEGGSWCSPVYGVLRTALADYDLRSVVLWHWRRYYRHLPADIALPLADSFEAAHPGLRGWTLAEVNRQASRDLYRASRDLGWRKLTARERRRYGLSAPWVREEDCLRTPGDPCTPPAGTPTGAGQYSTEAAAGRRMPGVAVE